MKQIGIKVTAEEIVRKHRESVRRESARSLTTCDKLVWAITMLCVIYVGIFVVIPFLAKLLGEVVPTGWIAAAVHR